MYVEEKFYCLLCDAEGILSLILYCEILLIYSCRKKITLKMVKDLSKSKKQFFMFLH